MCKNLEEMIRARRSYCKRNDSQKHQQSQRGRNQGTSHGQHQDNERYQHAIFHGDDFLLIQVGIDQKMVCCRVRPVPVHADAANQKISAVDDDSQWVFVVVPQHAGGERNQHDKTQKENIYPEKRTVQTADVCRVVVVAHPKSSKRCEAQKVGKKLRPEGIEDPEYAGRIEIYGSRQVKDENGHGYSKYAISKVLDAVGR